MTQKEMKGLIALGIIGLPIYAFMKVGDSIGWGLFIFIIIAIIALIIFSAIANTNARRQEMYSKYPNKALAEQILRGEFWQGQTASQLKDSRGLPHDIDQKILKTKKKEVWKYSHQGGNRYGLRITLDNDLVVGWDQKS